MSDSPFPSFQTCIHTGNPAFAQIDEGDGFAWAGSVYEACRLSVVRGPVADGPICDAEITRLVGEGRLEVDEPAMPPVESFPAIRQAVRQAFERGARDALGCVDPAAAQGSHLLAIVAEPLLAAPGSDGLDVEQAGRLFALSRLAAGELPLSDAALAEGAERVFRQAADLGIALCLDVWPQTAG